MTTASVRFRSPWLGLPLACLLVTTALLGVTPADLAWPFFPEGDVYQTCRWLKSVMENGSYYETPQLGAPYAARHYGFPLSFALALPLAWLGGRFTDNPYLVFNGLFFLGCLGCVACAYWALLRLGAERWCAAGMALAYGFLPNHLARYEHLSISYALAAPGIVWLAAGLVRGAAVGRWGVLWLLLATWTGAYSAFFSCALLLAAGTAGAVALGRWKPLLQALLSAGLVVTALGLVLLPNWLNRDADLPPLPQRRAEDIPNYALSLDRMLIPLQPQPSHPLAGVSAAYWQAFPNPAGPRESAYLGGLALLGLLLLLRGRRRELLALAAFLFLLGSASGLAPPLSMLIGRGIRCYNRVSFFLAFVGLAGTALALTAAGRWRLPLLLALCLGGLWEQTRSLPAWQPQRAQVSAQRDFVAELERRLPAGAMLWQIPWIGYPETTQLHREGEYAWSKLYLVSRRLHWSWGDMKGSWHDELRAACSRLPLVRQVALVRQTGFAGVVVLRSALADGGAAVTAVLGSPELSSSDGEWLFFPLGSAAGRPGDFEPLVARTVLGTPPYRFASGSPALLLLRAGWWPSEPDGTWSSASRALFRIPAGVGAAPGKMARLTLTPYVPPGESQELRLECGGRRLGEWTFTVQKPVTLEFPLDAPGVLELTVGNPARPLDHGVPDTRTLGMMLHTLDI